MTHHCPVPIDPAGTDIHAEGEHIRVGGPVSRIELPGGVRVWSVTGHATARQVLSDQRFSKDARKHMNGLDALPVLLKGNG